MCVVSFVSDYYDKWPRPNPNFPNWPTLPNPFPVNPIPTITPNDPTVVPVQQPLPKSNDEQNHPAISIMDEETKQLLREAVEKLNEIDKRLKDIECFDEKKQKFLEALYYPNPIPKELLK